MIGSVQAQFGRGSAKKSEFRISLLWPELIFELQTSKKTSVRFGVSPDLVGSYQNVNGVVLENTLELYPKIEIEPRFYIKTNRGRFRRGASNFSGFYMGGLLSYHLERGYDAGVIGGYQDKIGNSIFFYDISGGLQYVNLDTKKNGKIDGVGLHRSISFGISF
jgi:hypothetical protein